MMWFHVLRQSHQQKIGQVYPVWCSRLHNHTLFIKKLCKKLGVRLNLGEVRTHRPTRGCAHDPYAVN